MGLVLNSTLGSRHGAAGGPVPVGNYVLKSDDPTPEPFSTPGGSRRDVVFRPDGLRAWTHWTIAVGGFDTHQYDLPAAWQLTGWTPNGNILRAGGNNRSMAWSQNGDRLTFVSRFFSGFRRIDSFDQSATPYDISAGLGTNSPFFGLINGEYLGRWSLDELSFFVNRNAQELRRYNCAVAGDPSTITGFDQLFTYSVDSGLTDTLEFSADHTVLYGVTGGSLLCSWDLTAPDDISAPFNFSTGVSVNLPTNLGVARGLTIRPDTGDLILLADQNQQRIRCWEA